MKKFTGESMRKVKIWAPVWGVEETGQRVITGKTLFTQAWASFREVRTSEVFQADQKVAIGKTVFEVRYKAGLTERMYIEMDDQFYEIEGKQEIQRRQGWQIIAERKDDKLLEQWLTS